MLRLLGTVATGGVALAIVLAFCGSAQAELPAWSCGDDDDCVDPGAPYCDLDSGSCYPCLVDGHCGVDFICHQNNCIPQCFSDADCEAPTGNCSPDGLCLECLDDSHCAGEEALCLTEPGVGSCVECIIDEDCPQAAPWCKPGTYTCEECAEHLDCPEDQHCSQDACVPDICVPGALSCTENQAWVLQCDEFGSSEQAEEQCPNTDCEDGACGGSGGTDPGETGPGETDSESGDGPDDPTGETGENGATPLPSRGCSCSFEGEGAPVGELGFALLVLFGIRSQRRPTGARAR